MKKLKPTQLLLQFLKEKLALLLMSIVIPLIIVIIYFLLDIDLLILLYVYCMVSFLNIIYFSCAFYNYHKNYLILLDYYENIYISPFSYHAQNLSEKILLQSINKLQLTYHKNLQEKDHYNDELLDYYTLWIHQIKTPIAALNLLLQSNSKNEYELAELFKVEQYAQMALQYLRLDMANNDFVFTTLQLDVLIKVVLRKYSKLFILQMLTLKYDDVNMPIISDEKWITFVLEQLISNALKYTKQGSITIYSPKKNVLCIKDDGIGIQKTDLPRIFEKGFTGINGRVDQRASGIGLYLCDKIMRKLNHKIAITSTIDVGSEVILDFNQYSTDVRD